MKTAGAELRIAAFGALILVLGVLAGSSATAADAWLLDAPGLRSLDLAELTANPPVFPFPEGEELHYAVSYLGVPVGRAEFQVLRFVEQHARRLAHVVLRARTNEFFSKIFPIDDRLEAWIDLDTLGPVSTRTLIQHGHREIHEDLSLDWDLHWLEMVREDRHKNKVRELAFDFGPAIQDVLPAFYYMRAFPLEPATDRSFAVYASKKVYGLHLPAPSSRTITSRLFGRVRTHELRPFATLDGEALTNGRGSIWVREGPGNVPLRLRGWVRTKDGFVIGRVALDLVHHQAAPVPWEFPAPDEPPPVKTVLGRPEWVPPESVRNARALRGVVPRNEKRRLQPEPG